MSNCKGIMAIAVTSDYKKSHTSMSRMRCKLWTCSHCAEQNRKQWRATLYKRLPEISHTWSWHTFTTGSHDEQTIEDAVNQIAKNWERFIKRLKRQYGAFSYVRTIELHKSGYPHIHALFSFYVPDAILVTPKRRYGKQQKPYWYSEAIGEHLKECDFGYIASSENLMTDSEDGLYKALGYATKYMTKRSKEAPKMALRFIQTTRDIKLKNLEKSQLSWSLKSGIYEDEVLRSRHFDIDTQQPITADNFDKNFIYPPELQYTLRDVLNDD